MMSGAAGAAAGEAARRPDPLLVAVEALVERLLADTRMYPHMDWCAAAFLVRSGPPVYFVASGEGASYIPRGVVIPAGVRLLFAEPDLPPDFRGKWWGWANPLEPMLAYADMVAQWGTAELAAIACSTMLGGSVLPARGRVEHIGELQRTADTGAAPLRGDGPHRLALVDPAQYAQLSAAPDRSAAWRSTIAAAHRALARAAEAPNVVVPAVIGDVLDTLCRGLPPRADQWSALQREAVAATITASSLRPGWMPTSYAPDDMLRCRAFDGLARLGELLLEWQQPAPDGREIAYLTMQIEGAP